jgi:hypothetical protein
MRKGRHSRATSRMQPLLLLLLLLGIGWSFIRQTSFDSISASPPASPSAGARALVRKRVSLPPSPNQPHHHLALIYFKSFINE